jgi:lysophospholipase L1-like esterase
MKGGHEFMKKDWHDKEFSIMMTLGESTTAGGWTSCRERSWPHQLARMINEYQRVPVQLINLGIGANVISVNSPGYEYSGKPAADERLDSQVLSYTANGNRLIPDLLIISYGLNDARCGTPIERFCGSMKDIIIRVREKIDPLILLAGPYYMNDFSLGGPHWSHADLDIFYEYNAAIRNTAEETGCLFADLLASYDRADWLVHYDGCHANDLGHRIVADKIFEVLANSCSGLASETKYLERQIIPWRDESTLQGKQYE